MKNIDSHSHVRGESVYLDDIPVVRGTLNACVFDSPVAHGRLVNEDTISQANEIMQSEISPISDVRGTEQYKRLLLRQLFAAHFVELFGI